MNEEIPSVTVLKRLLGYDLISEEFVEQAVVQNRILSIKAVIRLTEREIEALGAKLDKGKKFELEKLIAVANAFKHKIYSLRETIDFDNMDLDLFEQIIDDHARYNYNLQFLQALASPEHVPPVDQIDNLTVATSPDPIEEVESSTGVKRSLAVIESTMPDKPIKFKEMKNFQMDFKNELRSMDLDHLLDPNYEVSEIGTTARVKYDKDNKFLYSCIVKVTKNHEAREWLTNHGAHNDGREGWKLIMEQYDTKEVQGSHLSDAMNRLVNLKLAKDYHGAATTYVTMFSSLMSELVVQGRPMDPVLAKEIFLNSVTNSLYFDVVTNLKLGNFTLDECMRKITIISSSIEKEAERSKRRIAKVNTGDDPNNAGLNFKGKPLNEFGFFVNEKDFKDLSKKDKHAYYKKKDELANQGKIKKKESSNAKGDRKRFIQKILNAVDKVDKETEDIVDSPATTDANDKDEGSDDRMTRVMNLLNSRNRMNARCG